MPCRFAASNRFAQRPLRFLELVVSKLDNRIGKLGLRMALGVGTLDASLPFDNLTSDLSGGAAHPNIQADTRSLRVPDCDSSIVDLFGIVDGLAISSRSIEGSRPLVASHIRLPRIPGAFEQFDTFGCGLDTLCESRFCERHDTRVSQRLSLAPGVVFSDMDRDRALRISLRSPKTAEQRADWCVLRIAFGKFGRVLEAFCIIHAAKVSINCPKCSSTKPIGMTKTAIERPLQALDRG